MMKKILAAAFLGSLILSASCGTARRALKDVVISVGSPLVVLYGAGTDGAVDAKVVLPVRFVPLTGGR